MKYLEIKSKGEIDEGAFTLIGASTKRDDDTKIGMYGSGNKYAIASMLRNNIDFRVFSGKNEIRFSTNKQVFRGKEFETIVVNDKPTSLTTDMGGSDWDNAFSPIREIYSNAMDEDEGATLKESATFELEEGYTKFFIELTKDVEHFYKNVNLYFCNTNPKVLYSNNQGSIYENTDNGNTRVFRKGILAHLDKDKKSIFHYNLNTLEINESRVVKNQSTIHINVAYLLKSCTDENIINTLILSLTNNNNLYLEHKVYYEGYVDFSDAWKEVLKDKKLVPIEYKEMFDEEELNRAYLLPVDMLRPLKAQFPDLNILGLGSKNSDSVFVETKPTQILVDKVIDAISILNKTRYKHRLTEPNIIYVKFQDERTLGMAEEGKIYLSTKLDVEDTYKIAKIIIEENEHNLTGFGDETRNFQNHLFNLYFDELTKPC